MSESIGMMEGAFFVPRTEIISWINTLLKLDIVKIEQTASGAIACQIMDTIYPGAVPMNKVNWNAKQEYEFVNNYKILQQVFLKQGLKKEIEVEKLVKAKYQDNLEFMQWLKRYYDMHANPAVPYDPLARRKGVGMVSTTQPGQKAKKPAMAVMPSAKRAFLAKENKMDTMPMMAVKSEEMNKELVTLQTANAALKKERDLYFGKLRDLEILVHFHEKERTPLVECIEKILYATEDDKITIDDKGQLRVASEGEMVEERPTAMVDTGKGQVELMQE